MSTGDDAAWREFHNRYGAMIFRMLLAATRGDPHLASDALQRTYLRIARHVRGCDNEAMWIGWLRIVARSALSDARRRQYPFWNFLRRQAVSKDDQSDTSTHENILLSHLDEALTTLEPSTRALLEMKYFRNDSVQTIAERLELSPKAVESRLTRARAQLREEMENVSKRIRHG